MTENMLQRSFIHRHPVLTVIALFLLLSSLSGALYLFLYTDPTITTESGAVDTKPAPLDLHSARMGILTVPLNSEDCFDLYGQHPHPLAEQELAKALAPHARSVTVLPNGSLTHFLDRYAYYHATARQELCDSILSSDTFTRPSPDLAQALQQLNLDAVLLVAEQDRFIPYHPVFLIPSLPDRDYVELTGALFGADGTRKWSYKIQLAGALREDGLASNLLHLKPSMEDTRQQTSAAFANALAKP